MITNGIGVLPEETVKEADLKARKRWDEHVLDFCRHKPLGAIGGLLILFMIFLAIFAPFVSPYDPYQVRPDQTLAPPGSEFWLGTDNAGRDILSRIIYGARVSLWVGIVSVGLGVFFGTLLGLLSGYWGGKIDLLIQRFMDIVMAFPAIVLALCIVAILGTGITNVMVAIAIVITPHTARIVRGAVLSVKENSYIEAAKAMGLSHTRIIFLYILPNVLAPILVIATIYLGTAILAEASLSFLGLGTQPPTPSWGYMLSNASSSYLEQAPWIAVSSGLAISMAVFSFNMFGDALRDVLDPRLKGQNKA